MSQQPPPLPPPYRGPYLPSPSGLPSTLQYAIGLFGGIGLSLMAWYWGRGAADRMNLGWLVWGIVVLKLCTGITLACFSGLRGYGAGILSSLPIGVMIFIASACFQMHW